MLLHRVKHNNADKTKLADFDKSSKLEIRVLIRIDVTPSVKLNKILTSSNYNEYSNHIT